jgi:RNA polymerase sigma-70 factor, ECF subfamily
VAQLLAPERESPGAKLDAASERGEVMQILETLPEHQARALEAKYGDGLSVEQIALQLGLTVVATQSLLARARETFRKLWQARFNDDLVVGSVPS